MQHTQMFLFVMAIFLTSLCSEGNEDLQNFSNDYDSNITLPGTCDPSFRIVVKLVED